MSKIAGIKKLKGTFFIGALLLIWAFLVLAGTYRLLTYEHTPGNDTNSPILWPDVAGIKRGTDGYTLLMTVHPKCSCSRASIGELSKLIAHFPSLLHAKVLFIVPKDFEHELTASENWNAAKEIAGVETIRDVDGKIAKMFNAKTSGFTLLYDHAGTLVFNGGITASRGHWGDNAGSQAINEIITKNSSVGKTTAAFGCSLFNKN